MKITTYFLNHRVIAITLNLVIVLLGIFSWKTLNLREYPEITIPTITVVTQYPNASPGLVESNVTNLLEDKLAGIRGLKTMTSRSASGLSRITLLFKTGTQMKFAQNEVMSAVNLAQTYLPVSALTPQVELQKESEGLPFIGVSIESISGKQDPGALTHYVRLHLVNPFRSVNGVSSVEVWGAPYTYEVSLDPTKLYTYGINPSDVTDALLRAQSSSTVGFFQNKIPTSLNTELSKLEDYNDLLIKSVDNNIIPLKSIATITLTTDNSLFRSRVNRHPGLLLAVNHSSDANPLTVSKDVHAKLAELQKSLPSDLELKIVLDQSAFIRAALNNIKSAIFDSIVLVVMMISFCVRNIRAAIIPLVTIPISILGGLLFLKIAGYSINEVTLLAIVLAIGLVVDDAIVVLENILRYLEKGHTPIESAMLGSTQIGFAIVAMTFTLVSVYLPLAFIDGMLGQLFIEFALALAGSVIISGVVALTLSPLMCATLLRPVTTSGSDVIYLYWNRLVQKYLRLLRWGLGKSRFMTACIVISIGITIVFYCLLPREMAPSEDRGLIGVFTALAPNENLESLDRKIIQLEDRVEKTIKSVSGISKHYSLNDSSDANSILTFAGVYGSNIIIPLKVAGIRNRSDQEWAQLLKNTVLKLPSIDPYVWTAGSGLPGLNDAKNGSELELVVSTTGDIHTLYNDVEKLKSYVENTNKFGPARNDLNADSLSYSIELDKFSLAKLNLAPIQVAKAIEVFFSGDKSIKFQKDSLLYNITVKGQTTPWNLDEIYLATPSGERVSIGAVAKLHRESQPAIIRHFDQMRSTTLHVQLAPHQHFGDAMLLLWNIAKNHLSDNYRLSWSGSAKAYHESSHTMLILFGMSIFSIYTILAIQFENFLYPWLIILTVPLASSGALVFAYFLGVSMNIYTQIGLVSLIALITKHGILIIEFANQLKSEGRAPLDAITQACEIRLRAILMTTVAMILGAIPLVLSSGAGSEARYAIGIVLIGGLSVGTIFTLVLLPAVYYRLSFSRATVKCCVRSVIH